eukprot:scaffold374_cov108-Isochrysis_galbana.AAC.2
MSSHLCVWYGVLCEGLVGHNRRHHVVTARDLTRPRVEDQLLRVYSPAGVRRRWDAPPTGFQKRPAGKSRASGTKGRRHHIRNPWTQTQTRPRRSLPRWPEGNREIGALQTGAEWWE